MEYDANMDREIDEDPDNSDAGDGGDPDEVCVHQLSMGSCKSRKAGRGGERG